MSHCTRKNESCNTYEGVMSCHVPFHLMPAQVVQLSFVDAIVAPVTLCVGVCAYVRESVCIRERRDRVCVCACMCVCVYVCVYVCQAGKSTMFSLKNYLPEKMRKV